MVAVSQYSWWFIGTKMFSELRKMTVPMPSRLLKAGPIHLGAWARSGLARSMRTAPGRW